MPTRKRVYRVAFPCELLFDVKARSEAKALRRAYSALWQAVDEEEGLTLRGVLDALGVPKDQSGTRLYPVLSRNTHRETGGFEPSVVDSRLAVE